MLNWATIYLWDNSANAYVDLEFAASDIPGTSLSLMEETDDRLYLGLDRTFDGAYFDLTVFGAGYSDPLDWEYWNGAIWRNLPIIQNYIFNADGVIRFPIPVDWTTRTLDGVEAADTGLAADDDTSGVVKYWIRVTSTSAPGTVATMRRTFPFPSYAYTTPSEVGGFLQLRNAFDSTTNPTLVQVEDMIRRIEGRIEGYTTLSWKPQYRDEEFHEFSRYGFNLKRYPAIQVLEVAIWNGGSFEIMSEGRESDWFVTNQTGIVSFSRLISLPFAYTRTRTWGFGEFRQSVRAKYIWGKDIDFDDRASMVKDITVKLVASDLLSNYDWTILVPQGTDRFSIEQKITYWREEGTERLEELRPLRSWVI